MSGFAVESRDQIVKKMLLENQRRSTPYLTHQATPTVASAGLPGLKVPGQSSTVCRGRLEIGASNGPVLYHPKNSVLSRFHFSYRGKQHAANVGER